MCSLNSNRDHIRDDDVQHVNVHIVFRTLSCDFMFQDCFSCYFTFMTFCWTVLYHLIFNHVVFEFTAYTSWEKNTLHFDLNNHNTPVGADHFHIKIRLK